MSFHAEIRLCLRARVALIVVVTTEEVRAIELLDDVRRQRAAEAGDEGDDDLVVWDVADGFTSRTGRQLPDAADPGTALEKIRDSAVGAPERRDLYVLKDFHDFWSRDPRVRRRLRNLAQQLVYTRASLVVTTPRREVPEELGDDAVIVDLPLPTGDTLQKELDELVTSAAQRSSANWRSQLTDDGRARLARAALGLTAAQARRAFLRAIVADGVFDERAIDTVVREKQAVIRESRALEFHAPDETPADVGGLEMLKQWLALRERSFSEEARAYGLPAPKGLALIGIPGTGKSLTAKMIGGLWHLPLLRLDIGALFGSLVGESEERVRQAVRLAETVAPCVLWIDELEKGFRGSELDGGTSHRVFATLLTWMQEKTAPVFVVATANDVSALPPETLRKGRFDEIFFLDLPTEQERREIISVHLTKRRRAPEHFDVARLARLSDGFTGAELEQAVVDAMYPAFAEDRDVDTDDIVRAMERTVTLSRSQREVIDRLRDWLRDGRAQSASFAGAAAARERQVPIELD